MGDKAIACMFHSAASCYVNMLCIVCPFYDYYKNKVYKILSYEELNSHVSFECASGDRNGASRREMPLHGVNASRPSQEPPDAQCEDMFDKMAKSAGYRAVNCEVFAPWILSALSPALLWQFAWQAFHFRQRRKNLRQRRRNLR